jgi:hypothetical protein
MLAPTRELVAELNARARAVRLNGTKPRTEVPLRDGNQASVGDTIITRHNDRRLGVSGTDWVKNGDRWTVTGVHAGVHAGALTVRHTGSGLTTMLPARYVAEHVDLGYASTVHTAQGLTADAMHGIVTGEESRQLLYTMLTRGRSENHAHVVLAAPTDPHQLALPGLGDQLTATEMLERILARDGAAASGTTTAVTAARVEAQLHEAVVRYADAVALGAQRVLGSGREDELGAAAGPLPWLPGIPADLARHETWGPYVEARAQRVRTLADGVGSQSRDRLPRWTERYADVLDGALYGEVALWRAAQGVPDDDRRLAGPPPDADAAAAYHRTLTDRINQRYTDIVRAWEAKIVGYVGRSDDQTLQLAHELDRLQRTGHDAERLLARAAARKPLPDDHPTAALAYRIRNQLKPRRAAPAEPHPSRSAPSQGPRLGL